MNKFSFLSAQRTIRIKAAMLSAIALILLAPASCAQRHAPALSELSEKYHPVRIATNVQARPGSIAWSLDGKTLAFIDKTIKLYDLETAKQKTVSIEAPHFLSWSSGNKLFALYQEQHQDALCSIDRESLERNTMAVDAGAEAIYLAANTGNLLVLSKSVKVLSFGTEFTLRLSAYGRDDRTPKRLYSFYKTYSVRQLDLSNLLAWTHAGLNPIDNALLVIEHTKPPLLSLYSRVITIDPLSGEDTELLGKTWTHVYASASWSPDGMRIALTDGNGLLEIRTIYGEQVVPGQSAPGLYPTWSPRGDRIYFGGYLIDCDGNNREALLTNGSQSIAQWSPDGAKLAVATGNDLWLFSDISPAPVMSAGLPLKGLLIKKMSLVQDLFRDGLISPQEYREQREKLMKGSEGE